MKINPEFEHRKKQNYAAIKAKVKRSEIAKLLPPLISEVSDWLHKSNISPAGSPFFNYIKTDDILEVEVGIPTKIKIEGSSRIKAGSFPEGEYAVVIYKGSYERLFEVHEEIEKWKNKNKLKFKSPKVEFYFTDPSVEPNPEKWQTMIINQLEVK